MYHKDLLVRTQRRNIPNGSGIDQHRGLRLLLRKVHRIVSGAVDDHRRLNGIDECGKCVDGGDVAVLLIRRDHSAVLQRKIFGELFSQLSIGAENEVCMGLIQKFSLRGVSFDRIVVNCPLSIFNCS